MAYLGRGGGVRRVGDGKRIRAVWLSLSMTICTANHGGRQIYVMILGSEKKKVTEKLAQYFWGEFQRNHCSKLLFNLFLGSSMKSSSRLINSNIILYDLSPTIALSYHWLTDLKMPTLSLKMVMLVLISVARKVLT